MPVAQKEPTELEIDKMLKEDGMEPSNSLWLIHKKSVHTSVTERNAYPLPNIHSIFESMSGSCWYSTVDTVYWQIGMHADNKKENHICLAYSANHLYHFKVIPFGLCNAEAS